MIMTDVDTYKPLLMRQVSESGVPILAVDFRPAPEVRTLFAGNDNLLSPRSWFSL